ncbi:hypothetical protein C8R47DRAFT_1193212 [Mycena vitilis]|nr:hypothetical protein C8R47DRAFT_1193212 [Mycena vitilis]
MSQPPRKTFAPPLFVPPTQAPQYLPTWRLDLRLVDFNSDFALPRGAGRPPSFPPNLNVSSPVAGQEPAYAESSRLPFLREDRWSVSNPRLTRSIFPANPPPIWNLEVNRSGVAQPPPPPRYNSDLIRWALGREPFSRHRLEPPRHRYVGHRQRPWCRLLRDLAEDKSIPFADIAHEICLVHIVMRWYFLQIVGPRYAPVRVLGAPPRREQLRLPPVRSGESPQPACARFVARTHRRGGRLDRRHGDLRAEPGGRGRSPYPSSGEYLAFFHCSGFINPPLQLFFERYLCWLTQIGANVRFSHYYLEILDRAMRAQYPESSEVERRDELTRLRGELLMRDNVPYVVANLGQPITRVRTIATNWVDPRVNDHGLPSDQPYVFESVGMAELFDLLAQVGLNGPGARIPGGEEPPDYSFTSAVLEGAELDAFVLEQGEDPHSVLGASAPVPPSTPTPSPSPVPPRVPSPTSPVVPSEPLAGAGEAMDVDKDFISLPPASPRPSPFKIKIPSRKRHRARVESEEDEEDVRPQVRRSRSPVGRASPPPIPDAGSWGNSRPRRSPVAPSSRRYPLRSPASSGRAQPPRQPRWFPPEARRSKSPPRKRMRLRGRGYIPPPRSRLFANRQIPEAPRLTRDDSIAPSTFEHEGHRAIGAVVRQLLPACRRCGSGRFCTDDTDPNERQPNKPRRTCKRCFSKHETCESWGEFYAAYSDEDEAALRAFQFEYWEHLGNGVYQLLHPDGRLSDFGALSHEFPYRVFLGRFLPLQNTQRSYRRRGDGNRGLVRTRAPRPASRSPSSRSSSSSRGSPTISPSELGDDPLDYDLEDEPALPPSQQASSSRIPDPSARTSTAAGSTTRPSNAEANESFVSLAALLLHSQSDLPEETVVRDAARFSAMLDSQPDVGREQFLAYMRGILDEVEQLGSSSGSASSTDRKGKGRAKTARPSIFIKNRDPNRGSFSSAPLRMPWGSFCSDASRALRVCGSMTIKSSKKARTPVSSRGGIPASLAKIPGNSPESNCAANALLLGLLPRGCGPLLCPHRGWPGCACGRPTRNNNNPCLEYGVPNWIISPASTPPRVWPRATPMLSSSGIRLLQRLPRLLADKCRLSETVFDNPSRDFTLVDNPGAPIERQAGYSYPQSVGRGVGLLVLFEGVFGGPYSDRDRRSTTLEGAEGRRYLERRGKGGLAQGKSLSPTDRVSYAYRVGEELWISRAIGGVGKEFLSPCMPFEIRLSGFLDNPGVIVRITRTFHDSQGGAGPRNEEFRGFVITRTV